MAASASSAWRPRGGLRPAARTPARSWPTPWKAPCVAAHPGRSAQVASRATRPPIESALYTVPAHAGTRYRSTWRWHGTTRPPPPQKPGRPRANNSVPGSRAVLHVSAPAGAPDVARVSAPSHCLPTNPWAHVQDRRNRRCADLTAIVLTQHNRLLVVSTPPLRDSRGGGGRRSHFRGAAPALRRGPTC